MHRLVSPFILEKDAAGEGSGHFEAASLFVDMSGFSAMTSALMTHGQHGAEVLATVMRAIFDPLVEAVYAHGGFITVFAGDAFTAVFPSLDPSGFLKPEGSAASRALAAAWTIRQHMRAHGGHETPYGRFEVGAKVGMGMGDVAWGIFRSEDDTRAAFYFRGPAIDACAQAEQRAVRGDLILHPSIAAALQGAVAADAAASALAGAGRPTPELGDYCRVEDVIAPLPPPLPVDLPPIAPEIQTRFFPRRIVEQAQTGEFRQAINVFIGLECDPTEAELSEFMRVVFRLQTRYGGLLNRLDFGDKGCSLLLFWGAPVAHENDILRALSFLLDLHDQTELSIRVGVTSHISHAGFIGSTLHEEYTCYGVGVNLAARLMGAAAWESIWVDESVRLRAEHQFELAPESHLLFKGFAQELPVYSLLGPKSADGLGFYERKMVGRARELAVVEAFVRPIFAPLQTSEVSASSQSSVPTALAVNVSVADTSEVSPQRFAGILVVRGEAGIGKSRLIHDFQTQHLPAAATTVDLVPRWCLCQSSQIVRQPLNPFRYWLQDYFGQSPTQSEAHNKRMFSHKLGQLVSATTDPALRQEMERTRSILGALVDLYWPDSLYATLDPRARYENTLSALKTFILAESLRQPLVLHLEDVHWLDDDSVAFVQRLVRDIEPYPLAILAAARPEGDAPLFGPGVDYQTLDLVGLSDEDLVILAQDVLGSPPGPALLRLLGQRADGNPFFAEQILFYLRDEKQLEITPVAAELRAQALATAPLPANVRAVFVARLDRLAQEVREVVQSAAVLGREFEVQVLAQMLAASDPKGLPQTLRVSEQVHAAEHAAIWTHLTEVRYLFKHVLLRDAAYDMQVRARRGGLHRLAAEALEILYAQELPVHYAEIAYHYEAACQSGLAELAAQARCYLTKAGEQADSRYENAAAVDYFTRALALAAEDDSATRPDGQSGQVLAERYHLLSLREPPMSRVDVERQRQDIEAMQALAEAMQDAEKQMEALLRRSTFAERTSDWAGTMQVAQQLVTMAHAAGNVHYEGEGHFEWGVALFRMGKMQEAREKFTQAAKLAQQARHELLEGDCLQLNSYIEDTCGDPEAAERLLDQAMAKYQAVHNIYGQKAVFIARGELFARLGRYAEAQVNLNRMLEISVEQGARMTEAMALSNLGMVAIGLGDYAAATAYCEKAIRLTREVNRRDVEGEATWRLGLAALRQGDLAAARARLGEGLAIVREVVAPDLETQALSYLALLDCFEGSYASARSYALQALVVAHELGNKLYEALALVVLGHAQVGLDQLDEAEASYRSAAEIRQAVGVHNAVLEARAGLARVALVRGDVSTALAEIQPVANHLTSVTPALAPKRSAGANVLSHPEDGEASLSEGREVSQPNHGLDGADDPLWIWLTWYQVWRAAGKLAAGQIIERGHMLLLAQADRMADAEARQRFLDGIPYHREIVASFRAAFGFEDAGAPVEEAPRPAAPAARAIEPGADLTGVDLHALDLIGANLRAALLVGANLRGVDLTGANLRGADLSQANLRGAELTNADLRGADLTAADLRGADCRSANLLGADLTGVVWDEQTRWPPEFDPVL